MRDIKFRVWDKRELRLDRVLTLSFAPDGRVTLIVFDDDGCSEAEGFDLRKYYIIEQFTGLHDADGREIWEGDEFFDADDGSRYEVKWEEGMFIVLHPGCPFHGAPLSHAVCDIEIRVIGNIHENTPDVPNSAVSETEED